VPMAIATQPRTLANSSAGIDEAVKALDSQPR
jgi:hypothetical protein